jgi:translation initiation factor IF-2
VTNPKVFEFAKEIGMTPLALMEKIREWHLPVKSHMAELDPETMGAIRAKLSEPAKGAEPEKKAAVRKKAPVAAAAAPAASKKVVSSAVKVKPAAAPTPSPVNAAPAAVAAEAPKSSPTVVRRKKTDLQAQAEEQALADEAEAASKAAEAAAAAAVEKAQIKTLADNAEVAKRASEEAAAALAATSTAQQIEPKASAKGATPAQSPVAEKVAPLAAAPALETTVEEAKKVIVPARKKEVAIGASGVASDIKNQAATAPRRNIVGRMDLSRVQAPPGTRPSGGPSRPGGPGAGQAQGFGGGGMASRSKGNIRAGFFQAPAIDTTFPPPAGGEFEKKKDDRRRAKGGPGTGTTEGSVRDPEAQPPVFDAAEFRKREMVFQPKKRKGLLGRAPMQTQITTPSAKKRVVKVYGSMKVGDLAQELGLKTPELIKALIKNGVMASINTELDFETIALIVPEFQFEAQNSQRSAEEVIVETAFGELDAERITKPPVVAVMGHVDHGKTSLLDAIRKANVAAGEAGGITQHIGAYQVTLDDGYVITFLDTPGHEAFTSMRARGANITDIAIIVVAAEDGVMPQTAEAINHCKAAKVPMIIAVNKMDKPGATMDRIKQQLTEYEVVPEEWGGTTVFAPVSALKKTGIKELLENIKLQAEVMELKANPKRSGTGAVIESRLEKGRGSVATILIQDGTVRVGEFIVAGAAQGKVRSLVNDRGERIDHAGPGMPVEVLGLNEVPAAGDKFDVVRDEDAADSISQIRREVIEDAKKAAKKMSLEEIFSKVKSGDVKELTVVLKADVAGSMEAIQGMFQKLATQEVKIRVLHAAIGGITETDVTLASTAKGIIIGFNVRPDSGALAAAKRFGVEIRSYSIVYELIDDLKKAMAGMLAPTLVEKVMGQAEVRNTFNVPKIGTIAGCMVSEGKIARSNMARLIRDGKIVFEGKLSSLKRFKDDAKEVASGFECGIGIENFNDIKVGDRIEAYIKEEVARELTPMQAQV